MTEDKKELKKSLLIELGMSGLISEIEREEEAARLTGMKFKPITKNEIDRRLNRWVKKYDSDNLEFFVCVSAVLGVLFVMDILLFLTKEVMAAHWVVLFWSAVTMALMIASGFSMFYQKTKTRFKPLEKWDRDLPLGALLAVKEAKAAGLTQFSVAYPSIIKPMSDPIIIGTKDTRLDSLELLHNWYEVFAWDDGVIDDGERLIQVKVDTGKKRI